jgi:hypothetical protein
LTGDVVYLKNNRFLDQAGVTVDLAAFAQDYVRYFNIQVADPGAWESAFLEDMVSGYYNNLEVMDINFWIREDVQHFVSFVDASWGIYLHRWGDAVLRYLALAMFAKPNQLVDRPSDWRYEHPCRIN